MIETGIPVVIALNMADLLAKRGIKIDIERLSMLLDCPIVETSALKQTGLDTVSYTHLDVYKRQLLGQNLQYGLRNTTKEVPLEEEIHQLNIYRAILAYQYLSLIHISPSFILAILSLLINAFCRQEQ